MNIDELRRAVKDLRINPSFYSILDSKIVNGHVLRQDGNDWVVYYLDERGGFHDKRIFETEDEACVYFLRRLEKNKELFGWNYLIHE